MIIDPSMFLVWRFKTQTKVIWSKPKCLKLKYTIFKTLMRFPLYNVFKLVSNSCQCDIHKYILVRWVRMVSQNNLCWHDRHSWSQKYKGASPRYQMNIPFIIPYFKRNTQVHKWVYEHIHSTILCWFYLYHWLCINERRHFSSCEISLYTQTHLSMSYNRHS